MLPALALDLALGLASLAGLGILSRKKSAPGEELVDQLDARGIVPGDPAELAAAAGVSLNVYALARLGQSEESTTAGRTAVMWATVNEANRRHTSVASLLLASTHDEADGFFGTQAGRYASTSKAPTAATLGLAQQVYDGKIQDPTGGANQWDAPATQALLHAKQPEKYKSPEEVAANREAAGSHMALVPGVNSTRFWVRG